jgi:hypothetical protein
MRDDLDDAKDAAELEIKNLKERHRDELMPLLDKLNAIHLQQLKRETKLDIGMKIKYRGQIVQIARVDYGCRARWEYNIVKKDGSIGTRFFLLYQYGTKEFEVVKDNF